MANVDTNVLKEELYPVAKALFMIGETLVDVSKSHISAEEAINNIRIYMMDTNIICSRHRVDKIIDDCTYNGDVSDLIDRREAISNLMRQPKLTKSIVRRVLAQTENINLSENVRPKGKWKLLRNGDGICNVCNFTSIAVWDMDNWLNFCPHCGADMREEF